jgi:hypothetical protein
MTASIAVESIATPPAARLHTLATPRTDPERFQTPSAQGRADRVDLRADPPPLEIRLSAAAQRTRAAPPEPGLTPEEKAYLDDLKARDREVRAHEQAHANAGGVYAGLPEYDYVTGPDGRPYAIGGAVKIDVSPVPDDPEATIDKMVVVKEAALAPREPSTEDRRVAAKADSQRRDAEGDLRALALDAGTPGDSRAPTPEGADGSFAARLFADVTATYRDATAFIAMSAETAGTALLA